MHGFDAEYKFEGVHWLETTGDASVKINQITGVHVERQRCRCTGHQWAKHSVQSFVKVSHDIGDTSCTEHNPHTRPCSIVGGPEGFVERCQSNSSWGSKCQVSWHNCQRTRLSGVPTKTGPPNVVLAGRWDRYWHIVGTGLGMILDRRRTHPRNSVE